ncbi:DUF6887 family protein [Sphaerospermopsis torques-reginae]|uniref:Transposase n=1 Tax=Sphaerospermopsis torques-reginae ITEP-024 TaxID=984208 RepID=A0ABX8X0W9_9CYAN|nr:hypothetical protein [Sphaerospermopsis torques-reginae]QYX32208.1 hypothetical protein K2F26_01985 [Sphaerospermopsis torques-reginae ITEP-024]
MTLVNYQAMTLKQLRRYVLTHRDNIAAFHVYYLVVCIAEDIFDKCNHLFP